jgi:hypothetical protein
VLIQVTRRVVAATAAVSVVMHAGGCAPALVEPPSLSELAGVDDTAAPGQIDSLLAQAAARFTSREVEPAREAARLYLAAAAADPARREALTGAIRVLTWLADHELEAARRESVASSAVHAAQWCGRHHPGEAACDYWLGVSLGMQARERSRTGLAAMPEIEAAFQRAAAAAPELDHAGPLRALALFYLRAPGWPAGPGDDELGLEHARRAAQTAPAHPPNLFALAEALKADGQREESRATYRRGVELATAAARRGEPDARDWLREAVKRLGPPPEPES